MRISTPSNLNPPSSTPPRPPSSPCTPSERRRASEHRAGKTPAEGRRGLRLVPRRLFCEIPRVISPRGFRLRSDLFGDLVSRPLLLLVSILLLPPPRLSRPVLRPPSDSFALLRRSWRFHSPCSRQPPPRFPAPPFARALLPLWALSDCQPDPDESGDIGDTLQSSLLALSLRHYVLPPAAVLLLPPARQRPPPLDQRPQLSSRPGWRPAQRLWARGAPSPEARAPSFMASRPSTCSRASAATLTAALSASSTSLEYAPIPRASTKGAPATPAPPGPPAASRTPVPPTIKSRRALRDAGTAPPSTPDERATSQRRRLWDAL